MSTTERDRVLEFVARWKVAGPELERNRWAALRAATDESLCADLDMLLWLAADWDGPNDSSGFVEMQRRLGKINA